MYKKLVSNKKAVAFDLDGTLAVTRPYWKAALGLVADKYGMRGVDFSPLLVKEITEIWREILKDNTREPTKTAEELTEETYALFLDMCEKTELSYLEGFPETMAALKTGKKFKTVLVTNTVKKVADKMLDIMDVKFYFNDFVYRDDVRNIKPDPEMYKLAAKKLGVKPSELLVFEDSPIGVEAAVKAGCDVIVIWNGVFSRDYYPNDSKVKDFITDFSDFWPNIDVDLEEEVQKGLLKSVERAKATLQQPHQ